MNLLLSLIIAGSGGYLATLLGIPLPWMLGSLFASICWNLTSQRFATIPHGRRVAQYTIGVSLGLYFTPTAIALIYNNIGLLFSGVFFCLFVSLIIIYFNARNESSFATIYFTYLPGGASEMTNLSKHYHGDNTYIAIGHTTRIILLVFCVPFLVKLFIPPHETTLQEVVTDQFDLFSLLLLFISSSIGVYIWRFLKQPNPWMLGALLGVGIITYFNNYNFKIPSIYLSIAQILLAMALAEPITRSSLKTSLAALPRMFISSFISIVILFITSYLLSHYFHIEFLTIALGIMPGGISEMSLTALQLDLDVPIVSTLQTTRLIMVMLTAKPIYHLMRHFLVRT